MDTIIGKNLKSIESSIYGINNITSNLLSMEFNDRKFHILKLVDPFFDASWNRVKTYEIRKDDRNYEAGDIVILRHYICGSYYGERLIIGEILSILRHDDFEVIPEDYCIIQLGDMKNCIVKGDNDVYQVSENRIDWISEFV